MHHRVKTAVLTGLLAVLSNVPTVSAIQPVTESQPATASAKLPIRPFSMPALDVLPSLNLQAQSEALLQSRIAPFQQRFGGNWEVRWDERSDRPNVVQGSGIALIPGRGNTLSAKQFGLNSEADFNLGTVAAQARQFIASVPELLQADGLELELDSDRSVMMGGDKPVWFLEFGQHHQGVRVDGAFIYVRVAQGNVVQFGAERVDPVRISAQPSLSREQAFERAWSELGFPAGTQIKEVVQAGELRIYPTMLAGESSGNTYTGMRGNGYAHVLAWRYVFRLANDDATWQVLVDAHTNRVIDARDLTTYANASVSGGIFPTTNTDTEVVVNFPYAAVTNGAAKVTDALGIYDYTPAGSTATATLDGKYFRMSDSCGSISLSNSTTGNLNFGSSAGTDCTTPGVGGAGNTHASRTGFYHLTKINEKARTFFPANSWLAGKVTASMNINLTCNASWNGSTLNFYKSGVSASNPNVTCSNTGELAAVFLHEWGHGMDTNSGGSANENGSGEAVGDTFAFLETRDSCIGQNFLTAAGSNCANCVNCSGVRDVGDFGVSAPAAKRASPSNLGNDAGINCDRFTPTACPYTTPQGQPYRGPMGYEGHCESYIASSANWDLTQALIARFGNAGWGKMDRIWYASLTPSKSAYQVASGGQCNTAATINGCAATNWYTVYLAADDDDGNLANGTPNACRIWDAMDAHGIACGTRPTCSGDAPDFSLAVANSPQNVCAPANATFTVNLGSDLGFTNAVTLAASGQPAGTTVAFSPNPATPGSSATMTVSGTGAAAAGTSTLTINGTAASSPGHSTTAQLTIASGTPAAPTLSTPATGATGVDPGVALTWAAVAGATSYTVEVATDAGFATIVATQSGLTGTSWSPSGLLPSTTYFWRVRASSTCGAGANATAFSFTTSNLICSSPNLAIPDNNTTGVNSVLNVADTAVLTGLKLKIKTTHTWVGDLKYTLTHGATTVTTIDRPGVPASASGCNKPNIDVTLDDASATLVEGVCNATSPAIGGTAKPQNPLSAFANQNVNGNWTLNVSDAVAQDTGSLTQWCLEPIASTPPATYSVGGSISGLSGSGLNLSLNGGANLSVAAAASSFTFPTQLSDTAAYAVTVATQPSSPSQTCTPNNASGSINGANVTNVSIVCATNSYHISGNVSGLLGSGLTLSLNGGAGMPAGNGSFNFPTTVASGAGYTVTVANQPTNPTQLCSVSAGGGTVGGSDITNVVVTCDDSLFVNGFEN